MIKRNQLVILLGKPIKITRFSIVLAIMVCSLMAGCIQQDLSMFTPSPDGSVIASIKIVKRFIPGPEPKYISHKAYLMIQKIPPSTDLGLTEMLITDDRYELYFLNGGLTWSPNGRSVAFTTGNVKFDGNQPCRLWIVGISANPQKALIAENVHSFRWENDTHLVYVTKDGEVYRATISDDGAVLEPKTLFPGGYLSDADVYAYHYCGLSDSGGFAFSNPLSPNAHFFVYANSGSLMIVNLSTATIEKSFPLIGTPITFWWDDASRNLVIGVQRKKDSYSYTHHYYLYQRERGTLTAIANRLADTSQFSPYKPSNQGRVWCSHGQHFVLSSGYPYYKTWLFNTASLAAVWMEKGIKVIQAGASSQLTMVPLPLEDHEYDSSRAPLPAYPDWSATNYVSMEQERNKMIDANSVSKVVIEPSPHGNLLAVRLPESEQKDAKSTCYVLEIATDPKGEMSLAVRKKIEFGRGESFLWRVDGRGLLFVADDKFRLESIP